MSDKILYHLLPRDVVDNCILPYLLPSKMKNLLNFRTVIHEFRCLLNYNNFGELQGYMDFYFKIHTVKDLLRHLKINKKGEDLYNKANEFIDFRDYPADIITNTTYYNLDTLEKFNITITINLKYGELLKYVINHITPFSEKAKKYFISDYTEEYTYDKTATISKGRNVILKKDYKLNSVDYSVLYEDLPQTTPITPFNMECHKYRISKFNQNTQKMEAYNKRRGY
jgi:hypothetical protein